MLYLIVVFVVMYPHAVFCSYGVCSMLGYYISQIGPCKRANEMSNGVTMRLWNNPRHLPASSSLARLGETGTRRTPRSPP
jgi:hypothetical protein